jgi:thiol-disulfide isomerase/thioredoxin
VRSDEKVRDAAGSLLAGPLREDPLSGQSFSGHERNHLFMQLRGEGHLFTDISPVSGLDHDGDGRAFVRFDYDLDGFEDLAVVNANTPKLQLFRNRVGDLQADAGQEPGAMLAVRFVGGNRDASPSAFSPRDGYGAKLLVTLGEQQLLREHRCGEGMGAQNSAVMRVGLGAHDTADSLSVQWPSGASARLEGVPAGSLVTAWEDASESPDGSGFEVRPYGRPHGDVAGATTRRSPPLVVDDPAVAANSSRLRVFTTMATWCANCKREQPHLRALKETFGQDELALFGIPVDPDEDADMLTRYVEKTKPAYDVLVDLPADERVNVQKRIFDELRQEGTPASVVTDQTGRILFTTIGGPTVSDLRRLLAELPSD